MNSLSKWVRGKLQHYDDCHQMLNSLGQFTGDMKHFMEDRRREMEEKQAARKDAEELKRLEEVHSEYSEYFDQEHNIEGNGDTAWKSPRITAKLAVDLQLAKEREAKQKMEEKEKAEKTRKRTEIVNLDARTHLQTGLSASDLLSSLPASSSAGSRPPKAKQVSATSVISVSSSTSSLPPSGPFEPSPKSKVEILPPKPSRKPKKMDILSDDEDIDATVTGAQVSKTSTPPAPCVPIAKPVTVEVGPGKFVEVEPSKPAVSSRLSQFSFFRPKLTTPNEDAAKKQDHPLDTKVSPAQRATQSSNVNLSESSKRKKSESPECETGPPKKLPQRSLRPWEDQAWLQQPVTDYETKKLKNLPECDFDLGDDFEDDMVEEQLASASVIQKQESVSEWPEEDLNFDFDAFEEEPKATAVTPSSSKSSSSVTPRPSFTTAPSSSLHEVPSNLASRSSDKLENGSGAIQDEDLIALILKRRKRSGQKVQEVNVVPETPEDDSVVIPDDEESIWGTPQESEPPNLANPVVKMSSREVERSRPVGTTDSHRKPLFGKQVVQVGEQKKVNVVGGGEGEQKGRGDHPKGGGDAEVGVGGKGDQGGGGGVDKKRWSSGEEVVLPEQNKPSLSSEDDIDEPLEEEIFVRKKVLRGSQSGQKRSRVSKMAKKQRASLSMKWENSDDDFL